MMEMNKGSSSEEFSTIQREQLARASSCFESHVKISKTFGRFRFLKNYRCNKKNATIERERL